MPTQKIPFFSRRSPLQQDSLESLVLTQAARDADTWGTGSRWGTWPRAQGQCGSLCLSLACVPLGPRWCRAQESRSSVLLLSIPPPPAVLQTPHFNSNQGRHRDLSPRDQSKQRRPRSWWEATRALSRGGGFRLTCVEPPTAPLIRCTTLTKFFNLAEPQSPIFKSEITVPPLQTGTEG